MKLRSKNGSASALVWLLLAAGALSGSASWAQAPTPPAGGRQSNSGAPTDAMDAPETNSQIEGFRHASPVKKVAGMTGMSVETTARIFEDLNSAILIGLILWLVFRVVPKTMRKRSETLEKQLLEARLATTQANERLAAVEERLSKLGIEIDAIREQTERDAVNDEKRIHETLESERQRMVAGAEQEIEAAGAAAKRELKKFAAELSVDRALGRFHLSEADDHALIRTFADGLKGERN